MTKQPVDYTNEFVSALAWAAVAVGFLWWILPEDTAPKAHDLEIADPVLRSKIEEAQIGGQVVERVKRSCPPGSAAAMFGRHAWPEFEVQCPGDSKITLVVDAAELLP